MKNQKQIEDGWFFHNHAWHLLHEIIKLIPDDTESLLDCGAGTGIAAAIIKAIYPDIEIRVIDKAWEESFDFWNERGLLGDICKDEKINLNNLSILTKFSPDFVMSSHVIEHVDNPVLFVSEMIGVAKKRVVIVVPDGDVGCEDHKMIFNRIIFMNTLNVAASRFDVKSIRTFPLYHPHINNLIGVIDL